MKKKSKRSTREDDEGDVGASPAAPKPAIDDADDPWAAAVGATANGFDATMEQYPSLPRAMTNERAAKKRRRRELHGGDAALDAPVAPAALLRSAAEMAAAAATAAAAAAAARGAGAAGDAGEEKKQEQKKQPKAKKEQQKDGGGDKNDADAEDAAAAEDAARALRRKERKERRKQAKKDKRAAAAAAAAAARGGDDDPAAAAPKPPKKSKNKFKQPPPHNDADDGDNNAATAAAPQQPQQQSALFSKMRARLAGGQFRQLNEALYTRPGDDALRLMSGDPSLFEAYHHGFQEQTRGWPCQPADLAAAWAAARLSDGATLADFGCGDARLARALKSSGRPAGARVHSLDLVASAPGVIACNMAAAPLATASCDAAVFSLALMGTDYGLFLGEARRVLRRPVVAAAAAGKKKKKGDKEAAATTTPATTTGLLWIAEVRSRFVREGGDGREDFAPFLACLRRLGFRLERQDASSNRMFVVWELALEPAAVAGDDEQEAAEAEAAKKLAATLPWPPLRACVYKKR